jgi:hypothetical protein
MRARTPRRKLTSTFAVGLFVCENVRLPALAAITAGYALFVWVYACGQRAFSRSEY